MNRSVKRLIFGGLVLLLLATPLIELAVGRSTLPQRRRSTARPRVAQVGDLFRNNCARCHGGDGRGDTALGHTFNTPDFTDPEWWRKQSHITSTGSLISIVSRGKGGMPAFGKKLSRTEIRRLVGYVRRFKNQKSSN
jgi:mono/diheme cytochrome c family protein